MEKNKNRTDLLAAGRKKLQQFRQKKDNNSSGGSHGKPSSKNSKSIPGAHADRVPPDSSISQSLDYDTGTTSHDLVASDSIVSSAPEDIRPALGDHISSVINLPEEELILLNEADAASVNHSLPTSTNVAERGPELALRISEGSREEGQNPDDNVAYVSNLSDKEPLTAEAGLSLTPSNKSVLTKVVDAKPGLAPISSEGVREEGQNLKPDAVSAPNMPEEEVILATVSNSNAQGLTKLSEGGHEMLPSASEGAKEERTDLGDGKALVSSQEHGHKLELQVQSLDEDMRSDRFLDQEDDHTGSDRCDGLGGKTVTSLPVDESSAEIGPNNHASLSAKLMDAEVLYGSSLMTDLSVEAEQTPRFEPLEVSEVSSSNMENAENCQNAVTMLGHRFHEGTEREHQVHNEVYEERNATENVSTTEVNISEEVQNGIGTFDLHRLEQVLEDVHEEGHGFINCLEDLKQQQYLSNVVKEFLHLQLSEQMKVQMESDSLNQHLIHEVSNLQVLIKEVQESKTSISEELAQCRSVMKIIVAEKCELENKYLVAKQEIEDLGAPACKLQDKLEKSQEEIAQVLTGTEELNTGILSGKGEIYGLNSRVNELQNQLEMSEKEAKHLSIELADHCASHGTLRRENANVSDAIVSAMEERRKPQAEKTYFASENKKLEALLLEQKENLTAALNKQILLESDLQKAVVSLEHLTEENFYLSNSLDLHKAKVKEFEDRYQELLSDHRSRVYQTQSSGESGAVSNKHLKNSQLDIEYYSGSGIVEKSLDHGLLPVSALQQEISDDSMASSFLKVQLEDAEKMLQTLEKEIQVMHSQSASLSRPGRVGSHGVSKLIQAFELKAHTDEIGPDEVSSTGVQAADSFKLAQAQISGLRDTLKQFELGLESLHKIFMEEKDNTRVALRVLGEEYEGQKQQKIHLETKNSELLQRVAQYETRIKDLLNQFDNVHSNADQEAASMLDQLEYLQKEANGKISVFEHNWQSFAAVVLEEVEKLNTSIRLFVSPSLSVSTNSDVAVHLASSVDIATQAIESLHLKLEAAYLDQEGIRNSYEELDQNLTSMNRRREEAFSLIDKIYRSLRELIINSLEEVEEYEIDLRAEELLDFQSNKLEMLIQDLQKLVDERKHLLHSRNELMSELMSRNKDIDEVKKKCFNLAVKLEENEKKNSHLEGMMKLAEDIEDAIQLDDRVIEAEKQPLLRLEAVVVCLLQKHKEAIEQVKLSKAYLREVTVRAELPLDHWEGQLNTLLQEEFGCLVKELDRLQEKLLHFTASNLQKDEEIHFMNERVGKMEEAIKMADSEVHAKVNELEQSEQKLASVREKLGIAVAKGKGLITQRDSLKQLLSEKCSELEKCLQELHSKDAKLHEIEAILKASESGERVEALESELSYIRNSAAALRESFLLKDSVLQRIEEVLEDLDLPKEFHSRDIIEKVEWLARSIGGNSMPLADWDQKSSVGGSYSDAGFVVMDNWREDPQPSFTQPGLDDLRRKYNELESKFYGIAEHNEMLEQSLMERNNLLERWEEVLEHINAPLHLRSMVPEDWLEWLGSALAETQQERDTYLTKIEDLETSSQSLISESRELHKMISDLKDSLVDVSNQKEFLLDKLEKLVNEHEKLSQKAAQSENELDNFHRQVADLQEKLVEKHQQYSLVESEIMRLQGLVCDVLQVHEIEETSSCKDKSESFERLLRKLISNYTTVTLEKSMPANMEKELTEEADVDSEVQTVKGAPDASGQELLTLKEELAAVSSNLSLVMEERDKSLESCHSLALEVESISNQRDDLQDLLNQEEQKSASVRERLNVAVRKGKGLVQQRDSLKQTIEEMSADMSKAKLELNQKIKDVMTLSDKLLAVESENSSLRKYLERSEQEEKKSKRAAELLALELDEVHERADNLNEEQAKADAKIAELSARIERAEAVKEEAVSNLEQFQKQQHVKLMELVMVMEHLMKACSGFSNLLGAVFSKDVEFLYNIQAGLVSCLKQMNNNTMTDFLVHSSCANLVGEVKFPAVRTLTELKLKDGTFMADLFAAIGCGLQECLKAVDLMMEKCKKFVTAFDGQAAQLPKIMEAIDSLHKEATESFKGENTRLQTLLMENNAEISLLHGSISLLYEACVGSIMEIENKKVCETGMTVKFPVLLDGTDSGSEHRVSLTVDFIRTVADTLSLSVKTLISKVEVKNEKELKTTILSLQKEIQEKDIHGNRICAELVKQIKDAEATAKNYLVDLQSAKAQAQRLEEQVERMKSEQDFLQRRVNELKNEETASKELQVKVNSLSDIIAAKDQEIEALMQALDEEESQMGSLCGRVEELGKTIQLKNLAVENLEASLGKALTRLAKTVGKFNELRQLSENLLSEIENLQAQLQGRDEEVSFMRQEVTRCTKDHLVSQESSKRYSSEICEVLSWLEMMALRFGVQGIHVDDQMGSQIRAYTEILEKNITSILSKVDDLRSVAQSRDVLLQTERSKIEELVFQRDFLERSLRERGTQLEMIQGVHKSGQVANINTVETLEVEPLGNLRAATSGPVTHVRSGRKFYSDQIAVGVDLESGDGKLVDEDDDKAHGFKSLATSRIVPRFTRSVTDQIDGLWVSGERMLMREPTLRLGVVIYWILFHGLLAAYVV